jgi:hypothetical protein
MRFVYHDPYAPRGVLEDLVGQQPIGTRREQDLPIPVDGNESSRITMEQPEVVDAVKGKRYREVQTESNRHKARSK